MNDENIFQICGSKTILQCNMKKIIRNLDDLVKSHAAILTV